MSKKLQRDTKNEMVAGVCSGLGRYFNFDATLIRLGFVVLQLLGAPMIPVYIVLWVVMPTGDFSDAADWEDEDVIEMPNIPKVKRSEKVKNDEL